NREKKRWLVPFEMTDVRYGGRSSFYDLGHAEVRGLGVRCMPQDVLRDRTWHDQILAQSRVNLLIGGQDLGHRLDLGRVQLVQLADVLQDFVNLSAVDLELRLGQVQIGQLCHTQHVFAADFHS